MAQTPTTTVADVQRAFKVASRRRGAAGIKTLSAGLAGALTAVTFNDGAPSEQTIPKPLEGQIYGDRQTFQFYAYDGTQWVGLSGGAALSGSITEAQLAGGILERFTNLELTASEATALATAAQNAADQAEGHATTALATLADIAADNVITPVEKPRIIEDYDILVDERPDLLEHADAYGIVDEAGAYDTAVGALVTYMATLTVPGMWNDPHVNTNVVGVTFQATFKAVYDTRQVLLTAITVAAKALADEALAAAQAAQAAADHAQADADTANSAAGVALAELADIASDSKLTPAEKSSVLRDYNALIDVKAEIDAHALDFEVSSTDYDTAITELQTYMESLGVLVAGWTSTTTDIVAADFRTAFAHAYYEETLLLNAIATKAKEEAQHAQGSADTAIANAAMAQNTADDAAVDAAEALVELTDIASDNVLTPDEKPRVFQDYDVIVDEQAGIDAQATAYQLTSEKVSYDAAVTSLKNYMATLTTPTLWSDVTGKTDIAGSVFRGQFKDVYTARQTLLNEIYAHAKYLADQAQGVADQAVLDAQAAHNRADAAHDAADAAQAAADAANGILADIADDNKLSPAEKRAVIQSWKAVHDTQTDTVAKADLYGVSHAAYDSAIAALETYLEGLGLFVSSDVSIAAWQEITNTIDGPTFRIKFADAYQQQQLLLNSLSAAAKTLADNAQTDATAAGQAAETANEAAHLAAEDAAAAQADADASTAALADIASDSKLTAGEKLSVLQDYKSLKDAKAEHDAQATAFGLTTEKTAYDNAINALVTYMESLGLSLGTNDVAWLITTTDIVSATFRQKFGDAYAAEVTLHNAVSAKAKYLADVAQATADNAESLATSASTAVALADAKAIAAQEAADAAQDRADAAATAAAAAQTAANLANSTLADIASDNDLTPLEKTVVLQNYKSLFEEQTSLDSQATDYEITTEKTNYDDAITDLVTYMEGLGLELGVNEETWVTTSATIVGTTFLATFEAVHNTRQQLLNQIATTASYVARTALATAQQAVLDAAEALAAAEAAQTTADTAVTNAAAAQETASDAVGQLSDISSDNKLTPAEKLSVWTDYKTLMAAQSGNDAQADIFSISRVAYDAALDALAAYMTTLGLTLGINDSTWITSTSTIVGDTLRATFNTAYIEEGHLLNDIAAKAKTLADTAKTTADLGVTNAAAAQSTASTAATNATNALGQLTDIASDLLITADEKPAIIKDVNVITTEQAGIDAQATAYGITSEKTAYDTAVSALSAYLATITSPTLWSDVSGKSTLPGVTNQGITFRSKFSDVYTTRQTLLNRIFAQAKVLADNAQTTANTGVTNAATAQSTANSAGTAASNAQTAANTANSALADIANDNLLTASEKPPVIQEYNALIAEQAGIDTQAISYSLTSEKTAYDGSLTALTSYLNALGPVAWNVMPGNTNITGTAFRSKFQDVYTARQALLNAVYAKAKTLADAAKTTADTAVTNAATAQVAAVAAQSSATAANNNIADITNDNILTADEKPSIIQDYNVITSEQAGIDAQATAYAITTEKTAYDNAITALTSYLTGLGPVGWNVIPGSTVIVGTAFRSAFQLVYTTRQALLNKILTNSKSLVTTAQDTATGAASAAAAAQGTANSAATAAANAQTDATNALSNLSNIASDNVLTPNEKPAILQDYGVITTEQAGIDSQATAYGITTEKTAYDNAVAALTTYLGTIPTWSTINVNTTIVGTTFRDAFKLVYTTRQTLLNKITATAKSLADAAQVAANAAAAAAAAAQTTANNAGSAAAAAQASANDALTSLTDIANDNVLTPGEKLAVIQSRDLVIGEQSGIDAQATSFLITTEKTTYDTAVTALTTYLATLTTPYPWDDQSHSTEINGTTFRSKFQDVYTARQALLNKIYASAKTLANAAQTSANAASTSASNAQTTANTAVTNAATAQTAANTANALLTDISSDSVLTLDEKPRLIQEKAVIDTEQSGIDAQAITFGITAEKTSYDNAVSALTTYLSTQSSPNPWNSMVGKTNLTDSAIFHQKFQDVYATRQTLLNAISTKAKALADAAKTAADAADTKASSALTAAATAQTTANTAITNAATANALLTDIASDDKLTPGEKLSVLQNYKGLWSNKALNDTQADIFAVARTTYDTALTTLQTYMVSLGLTLGGNEATWVGTTTNIAGATLRSTFDSAYTAETNLLNAISAKAKTLADTAKSTADTAVANAAAAQATASTAATNASNALTSLTDIASDSKLTPVEKASVIRDYDVIIAEQSGIDTQATAFQVTTLKTTYDTAVSALTTYMGTLTLWRDLSVTTTIDGPTLRTKFQDVYTSRQALLNQISAQAKSLAVDDVKNLYGYSSDKTKIDGGNIYTGTVTLGALNFIPTDSQNVVARINASAEGIKIQGSKIQIDGTVTFTNGYDPTTKATPGDVTTAQAAAVATAATTAQTKADAAQAAAIAAAALDATTKANAAQAAAKVLSDAAQATANTASTNASTALASLNQIADDTLITPVEKPSLIKEYDQIVAERPGIYGAVLSTRNSTLRDVYQTTYTALITTYLPSLTTPVPWNTIPGNTTIVPATFRQKFTDYYTAKQALLTANAALAATDATQALSDATTKSAAAQTAAISAAAADASSKATAAQSAAITAAASTAQAKADAAQAAAISAAALDATSKANAATAVANAAQTTANSAQSAATTANSLLNSLSSDNIIAPAEKSALIKEVDIINGEKPGIYGDALSVRNATQRTAYLNAFNDLVVTYLPSLTSYVLWSNTSGDTTVDPVVFRGKFTAYYNARQALITANAALAAADAAQAASDATTKSAAAQTAATTAAASDATAKANAAQAAAATDASTKASNAQSAAISAAAADATTKSDAAKALANAAQTTANTAATNATTALSTLGDLANDNLITPLEKSALIKEVESINAEKPGIYDAALSVRNTVARASYLAAYNAIGTYLTGLGTNKAWNDVTGNTVIVATDFRAKFTAYYSAKQTLINANADLARADAAQAATDATNKSEAARLAAISAAATDATTKANAAEAAAKAAAALDATTKADAAADLADAAQITANTANATANAAKTALDNIAADNIITRGEKFALVQEVDQIIAEKPGIYDAALSVRNTTQRAAYLTAYNALVTTYLPTLSSPVLWSNNAGDTNIANVTDFKNAFKNYYTAKQVLITANADTARADAAQAASDATTKSEAARVAAVSAAATDATTKAEAARVAAEANAAVVAQAKAEAEAALARTRAADDIKGLYGYSTDKTKIDGGRIYTGSVTTNALNFTPIDGSSIVATINASSEGIKIAGSKITIDGAVTFGSGYNPTEKATPAQIATAKTEAINSATATAATDATTKAATAKTEAINSATATAATDATTKATNAQNAAVSAAATDATTKATNAQNAAVSTAATDATTKATNAQNAAISAAALDATTKANNAKAAAAQEVKDLYGYTADKTKIDGGKIYTGTVYAGALNFIPTDGSNVVGRINASSEGIRIAANKIQIDGQATFGLGYDPSKVVTSSLVPDLSDTTTWGGATQVTVTDGAVGTTATRSATGTYQILHCYKWIPIDTARTYRTTFWARAAAGTNGIMYHTLQQADVNQANSGSNGGRNPYQPAGVAPHTDWRKYTATWSQANAWYLNGSATKFVQPDFLLNYPNPNTAGYWEIQGYLLEDITEAVETKGDLIAAYNGGSNRTSTVIHGGNILTNTLDADRINTSNYAEVNSFPIAGVKLENSGQAIKVAFGGLKTGCVFQWRSVLDRNVGADVACEILKLQGMNITYHTGSGSGSALNPQYNPIGDYITATFQFAGWSAPNTNYLVVADCNAVTHGSSSPVNSNRIVVTNKTTTGFTLQVINGVYFSSIAAYRDIVLDLRYFYTGQYFYTNKVGGGTYSAVSSASEGTLYVYSLW